MPFRDAVYLAFNRDNINEIEYRKRFSLYHYTIIPLYHLREGNSGTVRVFSGSWRVHESSRLREKWLGSLFHRTTQKPDSSSSFSIYENIRASEFVGSDRYQRQGKLTGRSGEEKVKATSGDIVNAATTTDVKWCEGGLILTTIWLQRLPIVYNFL